METGLAKSPGPEATPSAVAEKRDSMQRLLARLAHEIRNPLSSLDVHVQLLEEDLATLAPAQRERVTPRFEIIHGEIHRLKTIVENFLRLTRPSALELEVVHLPDVINHVCGLLRPEAAAREIEIVTSALETLPCLQADPVRLTQALLNLMINAMQAVDRQGRIEVNALVCGEQLSLEVRDNGPGIAPEKQAAIFEPYFTTKAEGYGLGLWIAQQIVTAHGGTLQARNAPERGAIFTMLLPLSGQAGRGNT